MCLGVPMRLETFDGNVGRVELDGVSRQVMLDLVPEARVGDWLIVHAGYALQVLDEEAARETLQLLSELDRGSPDGQ